MRAFLMATLMLSTSSTAFAGSCDRWLSAPETKKGEALVSAFRSLGECDVDQAKATFENFARAAGDLQTIVPLMQAAIDVGAWKGVWKLMDKVAYSDRGDIAEAIGAACEEDEQVVPFFVGAYGAIKGTAFAAWQPALEACDSEAMHAWLAAAVSDPPRSPYNEKYNAVLTAFGKARKAEGLETLAGAAVTAGTRGGPFNNILDTMQRAIQPEDFGDKAAAEDVDAMEEALVAVAAKVTPENARLVADRLYSAGNEPLAASLLPSIYPARVQDDGTMLWAAAAVESCDGQATVHWLSFTEEPVRLAHSEAVADPLRAAKSKLKCTPEGEWPVIVTDEPLADDDAVDAWVDAIVAEWEGKGLKVKAMREKKVVIN